MSETAKYVVTSKFAHFKVGQVVELSVPCPSAAQAHVRLHVKDKEAPLDDNEALDLLKELYVTTTGDKAGKKQAKTLKDGIQKAFEALDKKEPNPDDDPNPDDNQDDKE